eukprot:2750424-Karenia_brevis.AAC.1
MAESADKIREAKQWGAKFVLSADTWSPKTRRKCAYLAIYLDWISKNWEHEAVCAAVKPAYGSKTAALYL